MGASYVDHMNDDAPEVDNFFPRMLPGSLLPPFLRREPGDEATYAGPRYFSLGSHVVNWAMHCTNNGDLIICALVAIEIDLVLGEVDEKGPLCVGDRRVVFLRVDSHVGIGN